MTEAIKRLLKKSLTITTAAFICALFAAYGYWLFSDGSQTVLAGIASGISCALIGLIGANTIKACFNLWNAEPEISLYKALGKRSLRKVHPALALFITLLLIRILVFALTYAISVRENGYSGSLMSNLDLWIKGDAPHYLGIADNWYTTEGDARFHIVFFPFYPMLVSLMRGLAGNTFYAGLIVSLIFTVLSGILMYELALFDLDRLCAKRAVIYQMLLPAAFLLNAPLSDSLFLALSLACMLFARKKKYALSSVFGGLAALTRVLGILLIVPVFVELIGDYMRLKPKGKRKAFFIASHTVELLFIPLGFVVYLMIAYNVTGNAFTFLEYQNSHWNQRLGLFFSTASYQMNFFFKYINGHRKQALGVWLPNILYFHIVPAIMLYTQMKKTNPNANEYSEKFRMAPIRVPYTLRASYQAYFIVYYIVSMGATWLLSAPRYLTCCFPLSIAMAGGIKNRLFITLSYCVLIFAQVLYITAYVRGWYVY